MESNWDKPSRTNYHFDAFKNDPYDSMRYIGKFVGDWDKHYTLQSKKVRR